MSVLPPLLPIRIVWTSFADEGTLALMNRTADYAAGFQLFLGTRETTSLQLVHVEDSQIAEGDGRIAVVGRTRTGSRFDTRVITASAIPVPRNCN